MSMKSRGYALFYAPQNKLKRGYVNVFQHHTAAGVYPIPTLSPSLYSSLVNEIYKLILKTPREDTLFWANQRGYVNFVLLSCRDISHSNPVSIII